MHACTIYLLGAYYMGFVHFYAIDKDGKMKNPTLTWA
jgi:hypothetical protein